MDALPTVRSKFNALQFRRFSLIMFYVLLKLRGRMRVFSYLWTFKQQSAMRVILLFRFVNVGDFKPCIGGTEMGELPLLQKG